MKKHYDGETDSTSFVRCIDVMARLIQKYGSAVLEQQEKVLSEEPFSTAEAVQQAA